jgi:hypothetical protein
MPHVLGGIQRHSRMLVEHLARQGGQVTLYHTVRDGSLEARARSLDDIPASDRGSVQSEFVTYPTGPWFPGHYAFDSARYSKARSPQLSGASATIQPTSSTHRG